MEKSVNRKSIKLAVLCLMMVIMAPTAISPIIANLIQAFPDTKVTTIQFLITYPCILVIVASIIMGKVSAFISKKALACTGSLLIAAMGIGAFLFHGSVLILYVWATILGIGVGMVHPNAIAIVPDYFDGAERNSLMGLLSSAGNMGGIIMTLVGGALAVAAWKANYLVYLIALLGFFTCLFFVPAKKAGHDMPKAAAASATKEKLHPAVFSYIVMTIVFMVLFNVSPVNFSLIVTERALGGSDFTGVVSGVFLLSGIIVGILFGRISRLLKKMALPCGFLMLFSGYMVVHFSSSAAPLLIGAFIAGGSICLVIPQATFNITMLSAPSTVNIAVALLAAATNVGSFLSPLFTPAAQAIFGSSGVGYRYLLAGIIAVIGAVAFGIIERARKTA